MKPAVLSVLAGGPSRRAGHLAAVFVALTFITGARGAAVPQTGSVSLDREGRTRPFGTLREQASLQQEWLRTRLDTFLPALMRKHGIDMWVVPMREYAEDPIFAAIAAPETFAARRRTIYVFFDTCAAAGAAPTRRHVRDAPLVQDRGRQHRTRSAGRALGR
jgi:hypothetical protein